VGTGELTYRVCFEIFFLLLELLLTSLTCLSLTSKKYIPYHAFFRRYGASSGSPTEANLYADIDAVWNAMGDRFNLRPEHIILYGQSIGTVPTVDLASRMQPAGVVLHSPLTSGVRVAFPETKQTWFFDAFPRYVALIASCL
jgi:fermentation-respiration switch protein FrsA (DUF1100 family)